MGRGILFYISILLIQWGIGRNRKPMHVFVVNLPSWVRKIYAFWDFWLILPHWPLEWNCISTDSVMVSISWHPQDTGGWFFFLIVASNLCTRNQWNVKFSWLRRPHICVVLTAKNDLWGDRDNSPGLTFDSRWLAKSPRSPGSQNHENDTQSHSSMRTTHKGRNYAGSLEK